jgi:hypothetical protein
MGSCLLPLVSCLLPPAPPPPSPPKMPPPSKLPNFNHSQSAIRRLVGTTRAVALRELPRVAPLLRCAVVGNAGSLVGTRAGAAIDAHDFVIRCECRCAVCVVWSPLLTPTHSPQVQCVVWSPLLTPTRDGAANSPQVQCVVWSPLLWVTLRARWVTLRARWVTVRARWVTLRARWVTLRAR